MLDSTVRLAVPCILAAMAGLFCERSGVVDIALEGKMRWGPLPQRRSPRSPTAPRWACSPAWPSASPWPWCTASPRSPIAATRWSPAWRSTSSPLGWGQLADAWFQQAGRVPVTAEGARFVPIDLPFVDALRPVPILGPIYADLISANVLVYLTALLVPLVAWVVYRTRFGLRLRAVGENPAAVDTAGISVEGMRYRALMVTGAPAASPAPTSRSPRSAGFTRDMTAGKGYLALAALIFGKWWPAGTSPACSSPSPTRSRPARSGRAAARGRRRAGPAHPGAALPPHHLSCWPASSAVGGAQGDRHPRRQGA